MKAISVIKQPQGDTSFQTFKTDSKIDTVDPCFQEL